MARLARAGRAHARRPRRVRGRLRRDRAHDAGVREHCAALTGRKEFICFALAGDAPPFEESATEWLYRLACEDELRSDACAGYATLMDRRGETERARRYRERALLPEARRR
jgi:hypothetical protein